MVSECVIWKKTMVINLHSKLFPLSITERAREAENVYASKIIILDIITENNKSPEHQLYIIQIKFVSKT